MRYVLIGFMASGKSRSGKYLSRHLRLPFLDTDEMTEERAGCSIKEIFAEKGEDYFRKAEEDVLLNLPDNCVVATGGGIVHSKENRKFLQFPENLIIWLHPDWDTIYARILSSQNPDRITSSFSNSPAERPLTQKMNREELFSLWNERLPLYKECADLIYDGCSLTGLLNLISSAQY